MSGPYRHRVAVAFNSLVSVTPAVLPGGGQLHLTVQGLICWWSACCRAKPGGMCSRTPSSEAPIRRCLATHGQATAWTRAGWSSTRAALTVHRLDYSRTSFCAVPTDKPLCGLSLHCPGTRASPGPSPVPAAAVCCLGHHAISLASAYTH